MPNTLINGAAINGSDESGLVLFGMDLATEGSALAVKVFNAGNYPALELGAPAMAFTLEVAEGLELASTGTHSGLFNALIQPAGIELAQAGTATISVIYLASGYNALELGANRPQQGSDVVLDLSGLELASEGSASAIMAQPSPDIEVQVGGARALELGAPGIDLGTITVDVAPSRALEMGIPTTGMVLVATGSRALELGAPSASQVATAAGAAAMEFGAPPVMGFKVQAQGVDIGRQGKHSTDVDAFEVFVAGATALELGDIGMPTTVLYARQSIGLQLGLPQANRGNTC